MKVSTEWVKDYVDIEKSPDQLAEDLSLFGHEVDGIEKVGDDYVLDLEITPNRGDCLSILGIAREISAIYNLKLRDDTTILRSMRVSSEIRKSIDVNIEDPKICPRFTAKIVDNIKVGESPKWMQERLASYGFRPINNIVDITNYVMIATGQPLHAFDYGKITDNKQSTTNNKLMNIRRAKKDEEIVTLDGQNRVLPEGAIVIEDEEKIYDLAGIMGGIESEVDQNTKTIILQGAVFDPVLIRRASKKLNLITDASYRYERGVDFEGTISGVDIATKLILDFCSEAKAGELIDQINHKEESVKIPFKIYDINHLLGTDITVDQAEEYLKRLNIKVENQVASPPSYRAYDIKIWQDLAEEIARIYGYNTIDKIPIKKFRSSESNLEFNKREYIKDILKNIGFTEIYSYSFADKDKIELLGGKLEDCIEIANPLSLETQFLRPSILPSLLAAISKNPWAPDLDIFEIEKVFSPDNECWQLGIATVGKSDVKLKETIDKLNLNAEVKSIDQKILDTYKIRRPVKYVISDLEDIEGLRDRNYSEPISENKYRPISKFPPTVRDLAFIVGNDVSADSVAKDIKSVDEKILIVELFDEFSSDKFGPGKKNIAYHIWLQDLVRPLDNDQVERIMKSIVEDVEEKFSGQLRS